MTATASRPPGGPGAAGARSGPAATRVAVRRVRLVRRVREKLRRGGAAESGLATLVELCTLNAAADALVAVALAGTVFFNVPVGEARGKVALYLLITMAPFALLAPVIGPLLDRLHGRRVAMASSMVVRAGLCWSLAGHTGGLTLYPLALGVLVMGRTFNIARAAVMPRVLPEGMTLLSANSRVSLVGALGAGAMAPVGLGLSAVVGIGWVLRLAAVAFLVAVIPCSQLPRHVDSARGETAAHGLARRTLGAGRGRLRSALGGLPTALRAVVTLRALVGFLTLFLAFKLRAGGSGKSSLAVLAVAALVGQAAGITIGNRLGRRRPELLITAALVLATVVCLAGAFVYSSAVALLVALVATLSAALGKLGLDAVIQRDVEENVRASAFARSETALQLAWVAGGAIGLAPLTGTEGFIVAAVGMVISFASEVVALRASRTERKRQAREGGDGARRGPPEVLLRRQAAARGEQWTPPAPPRQPTWEVPTAAPATTAPTVVTQRAPVLRRGKPPATPGGQFVHRFPESRPGAPGRTLALPFDEPEPDPPR